MGVRFLLGAPQLKMGVIMRTETEILNDVYGPQYPAQVLPSAARTESVNSGVFPAGGAGLRVFINVTAAADTPSITAKIQGVSPVGTYYDLLTSAAITGTGLTVLTVYPGMAVVSNQSVSQPAPRRFRVVMTHSDGDSITYSVTYEMLP